MRRAATALLVLAGSFLVSFALAPWNAEGGRDLDIYRDAAARMIAGELPYRDFAFEYPPLAAALVALPGLAGTDFETYRVAFAVLAFALAAATVLLVGGLARRTGGDPARAMLAVALLPLLLGPLVRTRFDLAPVLLLLAALWLVCAGRPAGGMATLGLGVMMKGFPVVAAPVCFAWLLREHGRRAALRGAASFALAVAALGGAALAASPDGALDAVRYHLDRPVQVESLPAMALVALDALGVGELRSVASFSSHGFEHGAAGAVAAGFAAALVAVLGLLALAPLGARPASEAGAPRHLVLAALTAVAAFAVLGKVLSPQFLIWIAPLGALALAWRMPVLAALVGAATVVTLAEFPHEYWSVVARESPGLALVGLRDGLLLAALALAVAAVSRDKGAAPARSRSRVRRLAPRPARR